MDGKAHEVLETIASLRIDQALCHCDMCQSLNADGSGEMRLNSSVLRLMNNTYRNLNSPKSEHLSGDTSTLSRTRTSGEEILPVPRARQECTANVTPILASRLSTLEERG